MAYITETVANSQYAARLPVVVWGFSAQGDDTLIDVWDDASATQREQALTEATRIIDSFTYDGAKTEPSQDSEFPRNGSNTIPKEVKDACLELAIHVLKELTITENSNPWVARGRDVNATRIESVVAEARESVSFGPSKGVYLILHPYLKRWLKGRYGVSQYV